MAGVNKAIILGNLGADPEVKHLESGNVVANFSVATSEKYTNKQGEKVENTEWHRVVFWGDKAEVIEKFLKKGDKVFIEGKITSRSYESDGITKYITEIVGRDITILGGNQTPTPGQSTGEMESSAEADDLPF
jgi:single-strand DNA-binding protein